jgi:hypothetical protein
MPASFHCLSGRILRQVFLKSPRIGFVRNAKARDHAQDVKVHNDALRPAAEFAQNHRSRFAANARQFRELLHACGDCIGGCQPFCNGRKPARFVCEVSHTLEGLK